MKTDDVVIAQKAKPSKGKRVSAQERAENAFEALSLDGEPVTLKRLADYWDLDADDPIEAARNRMKRADGFRVKGHGPDAVIERVG